jgi:acetate kinase
MAVRRRGRQQLTDAILALNAGSSSLKFGLFEHARGAVEPRQVALGVARPGKEGSYRLGIVGQDGDLLIDEEWHGTTVDDLLPRLLGWIERQPGVGTLVAVGHRVVHGGQLFCEPAIIDGEILKQLEKLVPLAPLHQPASLRPVHLIRELRPNLLQIACFDTAFHRTILPPASRYALPRKLELRGIRRYGFHGLSFESIAAQLAPDGDLTRGSERVVIAHLGNGASLCALRNFQSVDTTMGFSTLDGLVMGTRPGSIDAGILLYLMREQGQSVDQLEHLLYRESGLLGVSGISADVGILLASDAPAAREALDLFAFQVARHTAALAATLGGLDRFVFTGGIGENAAVIRRMIVDRLGLFGAKLDPQANLSGETVISTDDSAVLIERRTTQEELAIARHICATNALSPLGA